MGQIIELLKNINYQISQTLLFNYKNINITDRQLIILIYLINQKENIYNPKQISGDLKKYLIYNLVGWYNGTSNRTFKKY